MFSQEYFEEIKAAFEKQMELVDQRISELPGNRAALLKEKKQEIMDALLGCGEEEAQALTFLYSAMPLSDLLDYPAELFAAYARHGVFLWQQGPFAGRVPEKLFANYVLHHRINNEDIADNRSFFYEKVQERIAGCDMYHAAVEANYWCAGEATYRATDGRTRNALTLYRTAAGRCGEESTFGVSVMRSLGIPARQVYAPLWSHCDDNHAWVEVWCDGTWYFLGACEPEERLNYGWFIGPAYRAMLLHSRWFGKDKPEDPVVGPRGMCQVLNHMERYAPVTQLTLRAVEESGRLVPGARVELQVLNHGSFGQIAQLFTSSEGSECGMARMTTGYGDICISVSAKGLYGERIVSLGDADAQGKEITIVLKSLPECTGEWEELDFHTPVEGALYEELTPKQVETGKLRQEKEALHRQEKVRHFYKEDLANEVLKDFEPEDQEILTDILKKACSNMEEIVKFLKWECDGHLPERRDMDEAEYGGSCVPQQGKSCMCNHWKVEVLKALREKDYGDITLEVLMDCCREALPYAEENPADCLWENAGEASHDRSRNDAWESSREYPQEVFYRYLVNPRVHNEMLRPCRSQLLKSLSEEEKSAIKENPELVTAMADQWIISMPSQEYGDLITSVSGCLMSGIASRESKDIFCVTLLRSLGIPARLRPFDDMVEYYREGQFWPIGVVSDKRAVLKLSCDTSMKLTDWGQYSLEHFRDGQYHFVGLWEELTHAKDNELTLSLEPGIYRILTVNRQRNGDQLAKRLVFSLKEGEHKSVLLSLRQIPVQGMIKRLPVNDPVLQTPEGEKVLLSQLSGDGKALVLWLEVTREPTEHILNELYDMQESYAGLKAPIYVVLKGEKDCGDATLKRTLGVLPGIRILYHDFGEDYRSLAKCVEMDAAKLPLTLIMEKQECIYGDCGYNVGLANILYRILVEAE